MISKQQWLTHDCQSC
ncbi:hypothetical protein RRG08_026896 [Elysia crispata]|uniref:Uncharacterized protein n=1 Tax=Elysia crispata TaxID=231223 RepID=A0AAE1DWM6_9GAST|nr:hypothetical protein RRG08_026896 [Elysia crispata]